MLDFFCFGGMWIDWIYARKIVVANNFSRIENSGFTAQQQQTNCSW